MKWIIARFKKLFNWVRRLPAVIKVGIVAVLLILIFGGSYASYRIYDYSQNDPEFCRSCHTMETAWERWNTSEHSNVGCHSCHHVNPVQGAQLVMNYLLERPDKNTSHAHITDEACEQCHYSGDPTWVQVEQTAGHQAHAEEQNIACQTCHGLRLHEFQPATEICAACHADHVADHEMEIKVPAMQDLHCVECHPFLREDSPIRPTRDTCLECHQKLDLWVSFPDNAPMAWDCKECHKPHQEDNPVVACRSCHEGGRTEGLHGTTTHAEARCIECHHPHEWVVGSREPCLACHSDKVAHNEGQLCGACHDFTMAAGTGTTQPETAEPGASDTAGQT